MRASRERTEQHRMEPHTKAPARGATLIVGACWIGRKAAYSLSGALLAGSAAVSGGCTDSGKVSVDHAVQHVELLARTAESDVQEVRQGLPQGAQQLAQILFAAGKAKSVTGAGGNAGAAEVASTGGTLGVGGSAAATAPEVKPDAKAPDPETVRIALGRARNKIQDLRVAKSTFFAMADPQGMVVRNDQEQDQMAGKGLFGPFPELRTALSGKYVETLGAMDEMAGVRNRPDGQWVAASRVVYEGVDRGLFVTGWSWSAYARRLQFKLRGEIESTRDTNKGPPLVYVAVVVDKAVYGWDAPEVDMQAVAALDPMNKPGTGGTVSQVVEITGRKFGIAVKPVPVLGPKVGVSVIRSEM